MAVQPGGYTDNIQDDNTPRAHPAFNRGKARGILETLSIIREALIESSARQLPPPAAKEALDEATRVANTLRFQKAS